VLGLDETVNRLEAIDTETLGEDEETVMKMFIEGKKLHDDGGRPHRPGHFDALPI